MHHDLKIHPKPYRGVLDGRKTFEIRNNDRDFKEGDTAILYEYFGGEYSGKETIILITYVTDFEQKEGYVVFAFTKIKDIA